MLDPNSASGSLLFVSSVNRKLVDPESVAAITTASHSPCLGSRCCVRGNRSRRPSD